VIYKDIVATLKKAIRISDVDEKTKEKYKEKLALLIESDQIDDLSENQVIAVFNELGIHYTPEREVSKEQFVKSLKTVYKYCNKRLRCSEGEDSCSPCIYHRQLVDGNENKYNLCLLMGSTPKEWLVRKAREGTTINIDTLINYCASHDCETCKVWIPSKNTRYSCLFEVSIPEYVMFGVELMDEERGENTEDGGLVLSNQRNIDDSADIPVTPSKDIFVSPGTTYQEAYGDDSSGSETGFRQPITFEWETEGVNKNRSFARGMAQRPKKKKKTK
jgi:hypothetical protein